MEVYSVAPWVTMPALMSFIVAAQSVNFSIQEQRSQVLQRLANMMHMYPVERTRRFHAEGLFVCTIHGDWSRKFQQLRTALSYKDLAKDNKAKVPLSDISDAMVSFQNALTAMMDQMIRMDGVFDRDSFEAQMGIGWVTVAQAP